MHETKHRSTKSILCTVLVIAQTIALTAVLGGIFANMSVREHVQNSLDMYRCLVAAEEMHVYEAHAGKREPALVLTRTDPRYSEFTAIILSAIAGELRSPWRDDVVYELVYIDAAGAECLSVRCGLGTIGIGEANLKGGGIGIVRAIELENENEAVAE